jgi:NitT/TauT family transport system substrate-binding protein
MRPARYLPGFLALAAAMFGSAVAGAERITLRVGYFPNITHAQGIIGSHGTRGNNGWFESRLGPDVTIQWFPFNAGPSAMEAIFAGSIDLTYVGPNPSLNAYIRSRGEEIRVLAGATLGGAALGRAGRRAHRVKRRSSRAGGSPRPSWATRRMSRPAPGSRNRATASP